MWVIFNDVLDTGMHFLVFLYQNKTGNLEGRCCYYPGFTGKETGAEGLGCLLSVAQAVGGRAWCYDPD